LVPTLLGPITFGVSDVGALEPIDEVARGKRPLVYVEHVTLRLSNDDRHGAERRATFSP
jgi:hypothetical protein